MPTRQQDTRAPATEADGDIISALAKALAHPARVRIIEFLLSRPGCIGGDIVAEVNLAQSTVSEHLRILKASGLVVGEVERPRICYWLNPAALVPLNAFLAIIAANPVADTACYVPQSNSQRKPDMTRITIYDGAMCCATGVCGANVDQKLVDFAADLEWLKAQNVDVRRINLAQEPMEFVTRPVIKALMETSNGDDLPAILVDGQMVSKARFPSRAELATFAGLAAPSTPVPAAQKGCCGPDTVPETGGAADTSPCCEARK